MTCSDGPLTRRPLQATRPLHISFGGCAALGVYHTGVWKCIADHAPHLLEEFGQLYGASAGAFTAVCAVCKCDPTVVYEWITETFKSSREFCIGFGVVKPSFNLYARLRQFLENILPRDAHRLCRNRVNISLSVVRGITELPKNWLLTDFTTRKELINVSHCDHSVSQSFRSYMYIYRLYSGTSLLRTPLRPHVLIFRGILYTPLCRWDSRQCPEK